jgi:hypothetical protein
VNKLFLCFFLFSLSFSAFSVSVSREVSRSVISDNQSTIVTVRISKVGVDGIAKLIEQIPKGFGILILDKAGGKVLVGKYGELKIVWLTLPVSDNIKVVYRLIHMGANVGDYPLKGSFTFIQHDVKQEQSIDVTNITVSGSKVSEQEESPKEPVVTPGSVVYKVQLGVFSAKKNTDAFSGLPDVHFKKINGFYKYFSGKFKTEAEAKKLIPKAKAKGFSGAFLVRVKK